MATTTNFGWETPDDTDLVKDGAAAMRTLGGAIDTSLVDLKGGTTGQVLSKASNTDMDFSWIAVDPLTILDAKGDLISATAADTPARLAVGTNGQVLTADSTTSTGLKWATASSGGMTLIQETTASANTAIDFTSISDSYTDLVLLWHGLYMSATGSYYGIRANSDSGSNYPNMYVSAEGTSPVTMSVTGYDNTAFGSVVNNGTSTTGYQTGMGALKIYNYASTTKTKKFEFQVFYYSSNNSRYNWVNTTGFWNSTSAISSLNIFRGSGTATLSNISNSSVRLYGVK